jgi:aryl-alcohol dehydrogenase-like predicted oxidoreductase
MEYTTLGKTGLKVSVAGLGCGGFSRLGLPAGKTEDEAVLLVCEAVDMGINFIDTAPIYGTEVIVGKALKFIPRQSVVVATKASVGRNGEWRTPAQMVESLESSLRLLGTDHIDVFQLHGVPMSAYAHARDTLVPTLIEQKAKGKIRHIGITELATEDDQHEMLSRAAYDGLWDVFMIAFHMMHQSARKTIFPLTRERRIGTLLMFAVRSIFAKPERVAVAMHEEADSSGRLS